MGKHRSESELEDLLNRGYRYALALTHEPQSAQDLVQDAWIRVLQARGPWRLGYFFRAIRTRWIDLVRQGARRPEDSLSDVEALEGGLPDVEGIVMNRGEIAAALGGLRPVEREVLFLHAVEEYTAGEIGEILGCPRNTVLSHLHRARARLRDERRPKTEVA